MRPYFERDGIRLFHGDAREVLAELIAQGERFGSIITDPVWPGASVQLAGADRPVELFAEVAAFTPELAPRIVVQLGRDVDPRMLSGVPGALRFLCACWLRFVPGTCKARLWNGGELACVFGELDMSKTPGALVPSDPPLEVLAVSSPGRRTGGWSPQEARAGKRVRPHGHPCPRRIEHVAFLVRWFGGESVLDPFAGSGTTLDAARAFGVPAVGVEIEEHFCEIAAKRLSQRVLFQPPKAEPVQGVIFGGPR